MAYTIRRITRALYEKELSPDIYKLVDYFADAIGHLVHTYEETNGQGEELKKVLFKVKYDAGKFVSELHDAINTAVYNDIENEDKKE